MKFFFNLRSEDAVDIDGDGVELPSLQAAKDETCHSAREMIAELILQNKPIDGMTFEIVDESGEVLATIRFRDLIRLE
ncbi:MULTISPECIES: DUF6894 family protein [Rhizobium]|uniref:DUF6894 domain-containing protein n=1 Tax=Rhizobium tropici TaxID=398 RepID=A0A6P1CFF8_RHITR|nr:MULTISPECIES: hypothetical protein [Rhizobium]AGB71786.1 hypothetical protein RTCIAT899_CH12025 [Rhizobium tropici CIAT 899]MBB4245084.1 hypothetical protein [Rhizobium tropici]MBB5596447.1 hypothetical protein [Rhizobium tropici]MBB6495462.1 hypothetical protein [Rhizobium tropici]NEV14493.1 hypothetical protein [Rhizobium tropici]